MESCSNQKSVKQRFFKVETLCLDDSFAHTWHYLNQLHLECFSNNLENVPTYAEHLLAAEAGTGRLVRKNERSKVQTDPWWKPAPEHSGPQTGAKVHLPIGQRHYAHSQDNAGVDSGQVSKCPWVAQPEPGLEPGQAFLERPENCCASMLPIQPDRAWEDLQKRMGETSQIHVCHACSVIPRKTQGCNCCQRCIKKVLSKGFEYLCKCDISVFFINTFSQHF